MHPVPRSIGTLALAALLMTAASGQIIPRSRDAQAPQVSVPPPPYAFAADLVLAAPVIVDATIRSTARIKGPEAARVAPGLTRFYVEADVLALIRGPGALPARIGYLLDVAPDSRGRLPSLKRLRVLLFARNVGSGVGQLQLVRPDAQRPWTPAADALVRRITAEVVAQDAPPEVTGIGNAFHTPGALPGEGETQIFLTTPDNRPVSIGIARRAGQPPRWGVSLSDVVDDNAAPPARDTLGWYRLACTLPATLPDAAVADGERANSDIAREDYRFVIASLGPCQRTPE